MQASYVCNIFESHFVAQSVDTNVLVSISNKCNGHEVINILLYIIRSAGGGRGVGVTVASSQWEGHERSPIDVTFILTDPHLLIISMSCVSHQTQLITSMLAN